MCCPYIVFSRTWILWPCAIAIPDIGGAWLRFTRCSKIELAWGDQAAYWIWMNTFSCSHQAPEVPVLHLHGNLWLMSVRWTKRWYLLLPH